MAYPIKLKTNLPSYSHIWIDEAFNSNISLSIIYVPHEAQRKFCGETGFQVRTNNPLWKAYFFALSRRYSDSKRTFMRAKNVLQKLVWMDPNNPYRESEERFIRLPKHVKRISEIVQKTKI